MAVWNPRANDLFLRALEVGDPAQRRAFVARACGGDAELAAQVEALLRASDNAGSFLERPALAVCGVGGQDGESPTPRPGDTGNGNRADAGAAPATGGAPPPGAEE